jgi:hypothetical protein
MTAEGPARRGWSLLPSRPRRTGPAGEWGPSMPVDSSDDSLMSSEFIPSVDELVEVHRAFGALYKIINLYDNVDVQEERALPYIVRIADALRPVRPLVDRIEGWRTKIKRSIPLLIEWFDVLVSRWGWEGVVQPEPARSAYLAQCKDWVLESLERPICEAAVSADADRNKSTSCKYDDWADEGRKRGIRPTMRLEEAEPAFDSAEARFYNELRIGRCYPEISDDEHRTLDRIFCTIDPCMKEVARERRDGPPVKGTSPPPTRAIEEDSREPSDPLEITPDDTKKSLSNIPVRLQETPKKRGPKTKPLTHEGKRIVDAWHSGIYRTFHDLKDEVCKDWTLAEIKKLIRRVERKEERQAKKHTTP